jgi:cell division protein FtsI (penicillin-binding protein 3)
VVEDGSGRGLNITAFRVGGKTGTAQIAKKGSYKTGGTTYQGSFVGYFPADKPLYSCIVVINSPANGTYYGGLVAGPVFKEIAEKVYSGSVDFLEPVNSDGPKKVRVPELITARAEDARKVAVVVGLPVELPREAAYVNPAGKDTARIVTRKSDPEKALRRGIMPDLRGMSARDALFLLENCGITVNLQGFGSVRRQSVEPGQRISRGIRVTLTLSAA